MFLPASVIGWVVVQIVFWFNFREVQSRISARRFDHEELEVEGDFFCSANRPGFAFPVRFVREPLRSDIIMWRNSKDHDDDVVVVVVVVVVVTVVVVVVVVVVVFVAVCFKGIVQ